LTVDLSFFPARKRGTIAAGIFIDAPVLGFRPIRADRLITEKEPNPTRITDLPLASERRQQQRFLKPLT
jgi:hypothetical protein